MEQETQTEKYNGWTNYETWCVNLWMANDEDSYREWRETAQDCFDTAECGETFTRRENAEFAIANEMKRWFDEDLCTHHTDMPELYMNLITTSLSEVNWHEIAKAFLEDIE